MSFHVPEKYRVRTGRLGTDKSYGNNGCFFLPAISPSRPLVLQCIASDGDGWVEQGLELPAWEHVSVSTPSRCPTWGELCQVKAMFWDDDLVIQFHPLKSDYVNDHPYCLHLWRPIGIEIPTPPSITVGYGRKAAVTA